MTTTSIIALSKRVLPFIFSSILFFSAVKGYSQLSGTYTLGDSVSDFLSFSNAVNAIKTQGLAGDVTFMVKPGNYGSVDINNIQNDSCFSIKFEYDGTQNDSAVITGRLRINNSNYITFKGFNIYPAAGQDYSALLIDAAMYCIIDSCKIINLHNNQFGYNEGLIYLSYEWEGPYIVDSIKNCVIKSNEKTIVLNGKKGVAIVKNSHVTGGIDDIFGYIHKRYYNNVFYCTENEFSSTGQGFYNNTFYNAGVSSINIKAVLKGNVFKGVSANISSGTVENNFFSGSVHMSYCNNAKVTGNIFSGLFKTTYCHGIKIRNNTFYENVMCNNDNTWFGNNLIYDTVDFSHGPGQMIINNNFERKAYFKTMYTGGVMENNNLANVNILQLTVWEVKNNNFVNLGNGNVNCYGENAHFYNPMYDDELRSANPLLTGKGNKPYSVLKYDIDSVMRKNPCTIGANEICFDWTPLSVDISCGDSVNLDLCCDSLGNKYWSPTCLFNDTLSANPVIYPEESVTVFLIDKNTGERDSLHINVLKSTPQADVDFVVDLFTVYFHNNSKCADSYFWDFGDGETSTEAEPVHHYGLTGSYTCVFTAASSFAETRDTLNILITSTGENSIGNAITVYPNPAKNKLYVKTEKRFDEMTVTDLTGKTVISQRFENKSVNVINTGNLPCGTYLLVLKQNGICRAVKFSK